MKKGKRYILGLVMVSLMMGGINIANLSGNNFDNTSENIENRAWDIKNPLDASIGMKFEWNSNFTASASNKWMKIIGNWVLITMLGYLLTRMC